MRSRHESCIALPPLRGALCQACSAPCERTKAAGGVLPRAAPRVPTLGHVGWLAGWVSPCSDDADVQWLCGALGLKAML